MIGGRPGASGAARARKIVARIVYVAGFALVLCTVVAILVAGDFMRRDTQDRAFQALEASLRTAKATMRMLGAEPAIYRGRLYIGNTEVRGENALVDELRASLGMEATLYEWDRAVATTQLDRNGRRRLGFRMPGGAVHNAVFLDKRSLRTTEEVDGEAHYTIYGPILDRFGEVIGAVQLSLRAADASGWADRLRLVVILLACGSLLTIAATFFLCGRSLILRIDASEQGREASDRHLGAVLDHMASGIAIFDPDNRLVLASRHYVRMLGLSSGSLQPGMSLRAVIAAVLRSEADESGRLQRAYEGVLSYLSDKGRPALLEYDWQGRRLALRHASMPDGTWLVTYEDITERRRAEERVERIARHDEVTGLANRATLRERLAEACKDAAGAVLMFLGLDGFRAVNEALGHAAGDALLREVALRLDAVVPEGATLARLGGSEFALVQREVAGAEEAQEIASALAEVIRQPISIEGREISVGASIGIVVPQAGQPVETLMRQADLALNRARDDERRVVVFEQALDDILLARRSLEEDLRRAVGNEEFELFYQPLVNAQSGRLVGFEALMRWRHPVHGLVPPGKFIPMAEETGLIIPMGAWALRRACRDAVRWPGLKVAVNLSPVQFRDDGLVSVAQEALAASRLAPGLLELEVTETALVTDKARVAQILRQLRSLGIGLAMDDFGTGYSSLAYLREFPFDKVKIDRLFVDGIGQRRDCDAIVNAVISIARELEMTTLAEGVETAAHAKQLRERGCQELQGYLFGRPMPLDQVPAVIAKLGIHRKSAPVTTYITTRAARQA